MNTYFDLIFVLPVACRVILDVWFEGSIFATLRAKLDATQDALLEKQNKTKRDKFILFFCELVSCDMCLSVHVCFWVTHLYFIPKALNTTTQKWNYGDLVQGNMWINLCVYSFVVVAVCQLIPKALKFISSIHD